ncbi:SigE family RNA polymerase sigma factor [Actinoplanes sp. NPDC049265]|uniref:SigE family RNA polymerase sigma factor n=1 Tax=Actinoplanes sp. NPDC049265 TaxID=3363902 RepID=UPI0037182461
MRQNSERDREFYDFVAGRRGKLLKTARLLTGGDIYLAEDLVQHVLTKLYVSWSSFKRADNPDGYLRRVLVNAMTDERRRRWRMFERSVPALPDLPASEHVAVDEPELAQALRELPPKMRAAIVFRFYHQLDVAETAEALGVSQGTVKSQTARALDKLRAALLRTDTYHSQGAHR